MKTKLSSHRWALPAAAALGAILLMGAGPVLVGGLKLSADADGNGFSFSNLNAVGASTFAGNGSALTSLNAANISSGTLATARLASGTAGASNFLRGDQSWSALAAADIPALDAAKITSGVLAAARLGSGTADSTKFLRGDGSWAAPTGGITGTLTSGRLTLSSGASAVTDDANLAYDFSGATKIVTLGNAADGKFASGGKAVLAAGGTNKDVELTPSGTGSVKVTANSLLTPAGSQSAPAILPGNNASYGIYLSGEPSLVLTGGGGNNLIVASSNVRVSATLQPSSTDATDLGASGARWKDAYARHYLVKLNTLTASTTLDATYQSVLVNSASATTITLPAASGNTGRWFWVKNISTGAVTVAATSGNIDGASTYSLASQYAAKHFVSDGTNWFAF